MWDNVIVAATNLYAFRAIARCDMLLDFASGYILIGAMTSSVLYHMAEHSKHNMSGVGKPCARDEKFLLNADRFFAALVTARFIMKYGHKLNRAIIFVGIASLACMAISECQHVVKIEKYPVRYTKPLYMITHCLWHIGAFHCAYLLLC